MADWILVPCLVSLRNEFSRLAPGRDKASDGSIGDTAHASSSSDHNPDETGNTPTEDADDRNEVHAIDVDDDLRKPGWDMNRCLAIIIGRHRAGRDDRLQNVIYNRRIWSRSWGWTARAYTGPNAHTEHAHFSARYTTAQENDTSPWGLLAEEDDDMPSVEEWLGYDPNDPAKGVPNPFDDKAKNRTISVRTALYNAVAIPMQIKAQLTALGSGLTAAIGALAAKDHVDERLLAAELAPGVAALVVAALPEGAVTPEQLQAAIVGALRELAAGPA